MGGAPRPKLTERQPPVSTTPQPDSRIGEVVEASSTGFTAECYTLYGAPPLGALVRVGDPAVYGVVYSVTTAALDPGRRVSARGAGEPDEASVYRNNPQIARLLATHLQALVVGHDRSGAVMQRLPAAPPRIHAFVYCCGGVDVRAFTEGLDYLHLLTTSATPAIDEVIAANIRLTAESRPDPAEFRLRAGKALAAELAADVARLNAILRSIA